MAHFTELATSKSLPTKEQIHLALLDRLKLPRNKSGVSVGAGAVKSSRAVSRAIFFRAEIFSPSIPWSAKACNFLSKARAFALAGFKFAFTAPLSHLRWLGATMHADLPARRRAGNAELAYERPCGTR